LKKITFLIGSIFCIAIGAANAQINDIHDFNDTGTNGAYPYGSLTLVGNKLYGMTSGGGINGAGNIFSINTDGSDYKNLWNFNEANDSNGANPSGSFLLIGARLYGMTQNGGINNNGNIFRIDTNGRGYKDLWDFDGGGDTNGSQPYGNLTLSGGKFYGMTIAGGIGSFGNIFRIDTNGKGYKDLWNFDIGGDTNGSEPYGDVTLFGGKLYGMTVHGGINLFGNIFSIDTNGKGYKDLRDFDIGGDTNGSEPSGDFTLVGNQLYGMTEYGGINNDGNIFRIDTNGRGYKDLWDFDDTGTNGLNPVASLILSGNLFYGMTEYGGTNTFGLIFSIDTNGSRYTDIFNFNNIPDGAIPLGNLTLSGSVLYGMTLEGGANDYGIVFNNDVCSLFNVITADSAATCHGGNGVAYITNSSGGTAPYTYSWSPGGNTNARATGLSAGTYTLTLTDHNGCSASSIATITQPAALSMVIHSRASNPHPCTGSAWATVSGGTAPYTYSWNPGGNTTDSISHQCLGVYCCKVTDANGCIDSICVDISSTAAIESISDGGHVTVYPNPSNGVFAIGIKNYELGITNSVEVYNMLGEKVYSQFLIPNSSFLIDLSSQPNGIYLYRIIATSGELIGEGKLVIQK